jgi:hypothetical protein
MFGELYLHHTYPHCKQNITKNKSSSPRYGNKHLSGLPMHDTTSRRTSFDEICHNCAPHEQNRPPRPTKHQLQKYPKPINNTYPHCKQNITKNRHTSGKFDPTRPVSQYPEDSRALANIRSRRSDPASQYPEDSRASPMSQIYRESQKMAALPR